MASWLNAETNGGPPVIARGPMPSDCIRREPLRRALDLLHAAREIESVAERRLQLARGIERIVGASMVAVASASRNADGWQFEELNSPQAQDPAVRRIFTALSRRGPGFNPALRAIGQRLKPGGTVAALRRDLVREAQWYESEYFLDYRRPAGFDDVVYALCPLASGRVFGIGVHRGLRDRPFSEDERNLIDVFLHEAARLEGRARATGDPALTPRQRDVLRSLLAGASEKQVAAELGISQQTVHAHVKVIYAVYGVSSRPELLVRCLRTT